jgi:hypothetical protein
MIKRESLFWGIILLGVGALLLLDNMGVLDPLNVGAWGLIWPLVLIYLGVWLLGSAQRDTDAFETEELAIPLEGAETAHLTLDYGAGRLTVQSAAEAGNLLDGTFDGVRHEVRREAGRVDVTLASPSVTFGPWPWGPAPGQPRRWALNLSDAVPLSIELDTGASDAHLDLTDLSVTQLNLSTGASSTRIELPRNAGHTEVRGSSGAATLQIHVPEGVAARIRTSGALASVNVDRKRFPRQAGVYQSPNYETAENKVDIQLDIGAGTINIH